MLIRQDLEGDVEYERTTAVVDLCLISALLCLIPSWR
jgi:hypothetical protein